MGTAPRDDQVLVDINDLTINFYTYQGIVKAIDGVDLAIRRGETLGLVGETGCGKSVTASSIMKLVMSPPGKIEAGSVFFMEPPDVRSERLKHEEEAQRWYAGLSAAEKKRLVATFGVRFTGFKKRVKAVTQKEIDDTVAPMKAPRGVVEAYMDTRLRKERKSKKQTQEALGRKFDLLTKSNAYMQKIRGRFISMIFQEPTSALNPVFTAGDQIAEVILQHRKSEMAGRVLVRLEKEKVIATKRRSARGARPVDEEAERWYTGLKESEKRRLIAAYDRPLASLRRWIAPVKRRAIEETKVPERIPPRIMRLYASLAVWPRKVNRDWRSYPFRLSAKERRDVAQSWYDSLKTEDRKTYVAAYSSLLAPYRKRGKPVTEPEIIRTTPPARVPANVAKAYLRRRRKRDRKARSYHFVCSICETEVDEYERKCHNCANRFYGYLGWQFKKLMILTYSKIFQAIAKDPDSKVSILAKIPLIKRYRRELYDEAFTEATSMLKIVRIPDPTGVSERYPHELSGGMQQRVMIAIALACNPKLLIADEPTTALDVTIQAQILKLMKDLKQEFGSSILLITHNLGVVAEMCDRVGVMYAGSMAEIGDARTIFKSPRHPYTQGLMKSVPSAQLDTDTLYTIRGSVPNLIRPPSGCRFHPRCDFAKEFCTKVKPTLREITPGHEVACHMVAEVREYVDEPAGA